MVHVPAKFWENIAMFLSSSAKTKCDGHMDIQSEGGVSMENFMRTAFKAYCGVLLGPVWSATCDIGINTITSVVNVVKFAMDDWFN